MTAFNRYVLKDHWTPAELKLKDDIANLRYAMHNAGHTPDGMKLKIADAIATPSSSLMFKRVVTEIVQEAIEPLLIGSRMLYRIEMGDYGTQITFGTMGAISGELDMGEGQEYPEFGIQVGGGTVTANIGKSGLAVKFTEEMIKNSQWDVVGLHLRAAGKALARHKEKKIFNMINSMGVVVFDNSTPASAEVGRSSGRDMTGAGNGSFTMDDLVDMYASHIQRGFVPDTILVHPLTWAMWMKDPVLREFAKTSNLSNWYNVGSLAGLSPSTPDTWKNLGKMQGPTISSPSKAEAEGTQTSTPVIPSYFPFGNLNIIPTFHMPFNPATKTTSIMMISSGELGALVVAEDPTSEEWRDPARDIYKTKIRERYGMAIFNEGQAVSLARNISVEPNEIVLPPQATVAGLSPIARK